MGLFDRVFRGSDEMFAKAEAEINAVVAELGESAPMKMPDTAYYLSCIYAYLGKGYADAVAAHETSILQFMSDFGIEYRILDEPLQVVGLGVAFALNDDRGLDTALNAALSTKCGKTSSAAG